MRLTTEEVAAALRVEPYTVRHWTRSKALRGFKVGRRWLYDEADVAAFEKAGQNRPVESRRRRRAS